MPFSFTQLAKPQFITLCGVVLIGIATLAITRHNIIFEKNSNLLASTVIQESPNEARIEVEPLTLRTYGFEPSVIRRSKGDFMLSISNRSRIKDLSFQLNRIVGGRNREKLKDIPLLKGSVNRVNALSLAPGDYVLTEASNPLLECRITITPE